MISNIEQSLTRRKKLSLKSMSQNQLISSAGQQQFLFTSAYRSIQASGVFSEITTPAVDGESADSHFQFSIQKAFSQAKKAGIKKPVVMGAVPFDVTQPSCLYVPQEHQFVPREELLGLNQAPHARALAILNAKSIPAEPRFKQAVEQAVANFNFSDIRKAVLSRVLELELSQDIDISALFAQLVSQNASGYHFRLPMPDGSELIGASPELLIRKQADQMFSNPLAGSAKRDIDLDRDKIISQALKESNKDLYEHQLVIEAIRQALEPYCRELTVPETPDLISTAAMWHLSTNIHGRVNNPEMSALQLACLLHPTPAVCGSPTLDARKLINLVESFERGLFTGMVGWCDENGDGEWVITIRCGTVKDNMIRLFAGAGIVKDSCPESEWQETEAKLATMLNALGIQPMVAA